MTQQRKPKGASNSTGGQFAGHDHSAPGETLGVTGTYAEASAKLTTAFDALNTHDTKLREELGLDIGHCIVMSGEDRYAAVQVATSTKDYLFTAWSTGEQSGMRINRERYASAADVPDSMRKAKALAEKFENAGPALKESVRLWDECEQARRAAREFDEYFTIR